MTSVNRPFGLTALDKIPDERDGKGRFKHAPKYSWLWWWREKYRGLVKLTESYIDKHRMGLRNPYWH